MTQPQQLSSPLYKLLRGEQTSTFNQQKPASGMIDLVGGDFRGLDLRGLDA